MYTIKHVDNELPPNNTFVVAHYNRGNWHDSHDQDGCVWKVVKFSTAAVSGNNLKPYKWKEFGPDCWFGQDVDYWFPLPRS